MPALDPELLYTRCPPERLAFETTAELAGSVTPLGQERAVNALQFGARVTGDGFNVFALGSPGTGKLSAIRKLLEGEAATRETPSDWCYVNNFEQAHKPTALRLPAGSATALRDDMEQLTEDIGTGLATAFDNEEYQSEIEKLEMELAERRAEALKAVSEEARARSVQLIQTPGGFAFAPMDQDGQIIRPESFEQLTPEARKRIEDSVEDLQRQLQRLMRQFPQWQKETRDKVKALDREVATYAVGHLIDGIRARYSELEQVQRHLDSVEADVVDHAREFREEPQGPAQLFGGASKAALLQRYRVNVLVDHSVHRSAPVVHQDLPSHANLLGRVEHQAHMGTLITDFTLIKPGDLHEANGGYLVLEARQLLLQPLAYESLKRALRSREIRVEPLEKTLGLMQTVSLEPEPIPLDVKVVLVGDRMIYYLLSRLDPEFPELFKVAADFEDTTDRDGSSEHGLACQLATMTRTDGLRPLDRQAAARVIERGARLAGDSEKLSVHLRKLSDLLHEADYWANLGGRDLIGRGDVERALSEAERRSDRVRERIYEAIRRGTVRIDTSGSATGQVNGLSVLQLGDFAFGQPSRITATVRLGSGKVMDIERETELGGHIHSKGVLILSSFLSARYAPDHPMSMSASLTFEQSYGMVDGDSASMAELCALLSALADAPIQQRFAITGSVNQRGQAQAIGGVNEKIEGFFDVARAIGSGGDHAVIIPAANVKHLMLREDVVEAVRSGTFAVHAVENVDEAIEALTGLPAGQRDATGRFDAGSLNARVERCLVDMALRRRDFAKEEASSATGEGGG